ncbi:MAG: hypothetical protein H0V50_08190 [Thermoleophilaceae bacterium]|nr:hypothetical protein [Thermoleophilaceae bacterium]
MAVGVGVTVDVGVGAGVGSGFDKGQGQEFPTLPGDGAPSKYPPIISLMFTLAYALMVRLDNPGVERINVNARKTYKKLLYFFIYTLTPFKIVFLCKLKSISMSNSALCMLIPRI